MNPIQEKIIRLSYKLTDEEIGQICGYLLSFIGISNTVFEEFWKQLDDDNKDVLYTRLNEISNK